MFLHIDIYDVNDVIARIADHYDSLEDAEKEAKIIAKEYPSAVKYTVGRQHYINRSIKWHTRRGRIHQIYSEP